MHQTTKEQAVVHEYVYLLNVYCLLQSIASVQCRKQKNNDRKNIINIDDVKLFKKIIKTHTNLLVLFAQTGKTLYER